MDLFEKLLKEAERASRDEDLPNNLLEMIRDICHNPSKYTDHDLIEDLIERLEDYEPFADVGCGNESYSTADVQKAVEAIISK
ncbi:MAG: GSU3529 family protein [Deferribacterales bacterium]